MVERDSLPPVELHQPCLAFFLLLCFYESLGKCVKGNEEGEE